MSQADEPVVIVDDEPVEVVTVHEGHRVATYSYGSGENVLPLLNGGPGNPSIDIRKNVENQAGPALRVIAFDQLGTALDHTGGQSHQTAYFCQPFLAGCRRPSSCSCVYLPAAAGRCVEDHRMPQIAP